MLRKYDIDYIYNIRDNINNKLEDDLINYFNEIVKEIQIKEEQLIINEEKNKYKNNKYQKNKFIKNNNNFEDNFKKYNTEINYKSSLNNINRIKNVNSIKENDKIIIDIRKILNKISHKNYQKLKNEFNCYYKQILLQDDIDITMINNFIFDNIVYNNIFYSDIYVNLIITLININSNFEIIVNQNINILLNIYKYLDSYDKYKCFCIFYVNCVINKIIPIDIIIKTLNNLQCELISNFKKQENKDYCDNLNNLIFSIITKIFNTNVYKENYNLFSDFYNTCSNIKNLNKNENPSLSNKTVFLNMDIIEKFNLKI
tara:strand:+ start:2519 stop:3463 length:945 start_codon:yes stop_codon:yes gene_type:complete